MSQAPATDPIIGKTLDSKYRIESLMGKGGMGRVFKATHTQLNKTFALKLMNFNPTDSDPSRLIRFKREAEALARINHPNVVMVTDFGVTEQQVPYIVMEFIEGVSLRNLLDKLGKLSDKQAILIAKQICAGLHAAHTQGIVHRDLKPENIMIQQLADEEIMARVLDFGIAKVLQEDPANQNLTGNEELLGTLKYMTPEQFLGSAVDARSDVFGICLITYEMLAGIVPPAVMSMAQPLHELRPDTSQRLSDILLRGLAQAPEQRQQSALELKRELENLEHSNLLESISVNERSLDSNSDLAVRLASGSNASQIRSVTINSNAVESLGGKSAPNIPVPMPIAPASSKLIPILMLMILLVAGGGALAFYEPLRTMVFGEKIDKFPESARPPMVRVRGGEFMMGANITVKDPKDLRGIHSPAHSAKVEDMEVSRFFITNRQYYEFVKSEKGNSPTSWGGKEPPPELLEKPVVGVSWIEAKAYCRWLSSKTGQNYRLLTETEWEYIAQNRNKMNIMVENLMTGKLGEWTDTEVQSYPDSKYKFPPDAVASTRIVRGFFEKDGDDAKVIPLEHYRTWRTETDGFPIISFRVVRKPQD
jgi:eukaryotic-like serine/threonine-protein kinase